MALSQERTYPQMAIRSWEKRQFCQRVHWSLGYQLFKHQGLTIHIIQYYNIELYILLLLLSLYYYYYHYIIIIYHNHIICYTLLKKKLEIIEPQAFWSSAKSRCGSCNMLQHSGKCYLPIWDEKSYDNHSMIVVIHGHFLLISMATLDIFGYISN